jgi:malate dehydrogenase (quinone)
LGNTDKHYDVVLIGGGIMSATLGLLLRQVRPDASILLVERLGQVGQESSSPWHNAGTGHAALCELHYTPRRPDGSIDTSKAILVNEQFQRSLQLYSWVVKQGLVVDPATFINPVPHVGFCEGEGDVQFLRARHEAMVREPQFADIEFTDSPDTIAEWTPLLMQGRSASQPVAATNARFGTDVNFGALTTSMITWLQGQGMDLLLGHQVTNVTKSGSRWNLNIDNRLSDEKQSISAGFVFVGAGGTALHLLQQSGIKEIKGVGGFPVSGQFLRSTNPDLIAQHHAKVYGRPATGAPPMTAPHLDSRVIDGKRGLMFGPYAGFSPKFLKQGSWSDLFRSIRADNLLTMLTVGKNELPLTAYLIRQVLQSKSDRIDQLRKFYPEASQGGWELIQAGQRVQVMRPTATKRGILQFGTEVIAAQDGSIVGLLGASPGASTATAIMVDVLRRCFPKDYASWLPRLEEILPHVDVNLADQPELFAEIRQTSGDVLFPTRTHA